ncbi:MAG: DNA recombination protein RmuC, partial [Actinomycetota bacterium]|nr:DNA recombination protein RmuC [Actinomycetota bacterium]
GDADLDRRARALEQLVDPVREQLGRVEGQLSALDRERVRASAELRAQVESVATGSDLLRRETAALVDALRRPQARGRWGELQLRRVCELAGMLDRCDFDEQVGVPGPGGVLRPDLVVRLPGERCVLVDAKVSLAAHLEALEADDPQVRQERSAAHARHLRAHVDRLADKAYWRQVPGGPEFVVLFLPGEALLAPALEADPALLEHAAARRVHVATPTTLLSLLRAVAHGWQQEALADDAAAVLAAGKELFDRLATFGGHVEKLGRSLARAVGDFNSAVGSLERSVLPSVRRMSELGLAGEAPGVATVEDVPRPLTAAHLTVVAAEEPAARAAPG